MKRLFVVLLAWFSFVVPFKTQAQNFVTDSLDNYVRQGMKDWNLPGLAIAIIKDGKVVAMKGYGVRDIKTKEPVDENTLFLIASNSKLFTATALAQLDYDKKLSLNDKITKYFPDYKTVRCQHYSFSYDKRHAFAPPRDRDFSGRFYFLERQPFAPANYGKNETA